MFEVAARNHKENTGYQYPRRRERRSFSEAVTCSSIVAPRGELNANSSVAGTPETMSSDSKREGKARIAAFTLSYRSKCSQFGSGTFKSGGSGISHNAS